MDGDNLILQLTLTAEQKRFREVREVAVPLSAIDLMKLERRWIKPPLIRLHVRDLRLFAEVPGSRGGALTLRISRDDQLNAKELIATAMLAREEHEAARLSRPDRTLPGLE